MRSIRISPTLQDHRFQVAFLDGVFRFRVRWNPRLQSFMMSIYDSTDAPLVQGMRLCLDSDYLRPFQAHAEMPPGALLSIHVGEHEEEPNRTNIGTLVRLLYIDDDQ